MKSDVKSDPLPLQQRAWYILIIHFFTVMSSVMSSYVVGLRYNCIVRSLVTPLQVTPLQSTLLMSPVRLLHFD